jgi:AcrR family transcriptional regulator
MTSPATPRSRARPEPKPAPKTAPAGRAYAGLAAGERVAARRARFVEAGIELFGTQGFRGATVRGVCAAAGLTDRYFYESFESLEALLVASYRTLVEALAQRLAREAIRSAAWAGDAQDVERQCALGYEIWFAAVRDPRFARIVLVEVLGVSAAIDAVYEQAMREIAELTIAPLATALPGLRLSKARRAMLGRALVGAAVQVAKQWFTEGYRAPRRDVVRTCVLVATGTLAALRAEAAGA